MAVELVKNDKQLCIRRTIDFKALLRRVGYINLESSKDLDNSKDTKSYRIFLLSLMKIYYLYIF